MNQWKQIFNVSRELFFVGKGNPISHNGQGPCQQRRLPFPLNFEPSCMQIEHPQSIDSMTTTKIYLLLYPHARKALTPAKSLTLSWDRAGRKDKDQYLQNAQLAVHQ